MSAVFAYWWKIQFFFSFRYTACFDWPFHPKPCRLVLLGFIKMIISWESTHSPIIHYNLAFLCYFLSWASPRSSTACMRLWQKMKYKQKQNLIMHELWAGRPMPWEGQWQRPSKLAIIYWVYTIIDEIIDWLREWQQSYTEENFYVDEDSRTKWQLKTEFDFPQGETLFWLLLGSQGTRMSSTDILLLWEIVVSLDHWGDCNQRHTKFSPA